MRISIKKTKQTSNQKLNSKQHKNHCPSNTEVILEKAYIVFVSF